MKKIRFASSLMVSGALFLAACNTPGSAPITTPGAGGFPGSETTPQSTLDLNATPGDQTGTDLGTQTPGLFATETPGVDTGAAGTDLVTPTVNVGDAGSDLTATGTPAVDTGSTGQATTEAPAAGTGAEGQSAQVQPGMAEGFIRLSRLMDGNVQLSDSQPGGSLRGVLVTGPTISGATTNTAVGVNPPKISYVVMDVVAGNEAGAQPTVEVTTESPQAAANEAYRESWSQLAGENDLVLVPWQAVTVSETDSTMGAVSASIDMDSAALAAAPHFSASNPPDFASGNWNVVTDEYWASQGMGVPVTGDAGTEIGQPVLMTAPFNGVNVTLEDGTTVAQVNDFLVDSATGELSYVILSGANLGERYLVIPAGALTWDQVTTLGAESGLNAANGFSLNISEDMFNSAPVQDAIDNLEQGDTTWQETVDQYWEDFLNTGSEQVK